MDVAGKVTTWVQPEEEEKGCARSENICKALAVLTWARTDQFPWALQLYCFQPQGWLIWGSFRDLCTFLPCDMYIHRRARWYWGHSWPPAAKQQTWCWFPCDHNAVGCYWSPARSQALHMWSYCHCPFLNLLPLPGTERFGNLCVLCMKQVIVF